MNYIKRKFLLFAAPLQPIFFFTSTEYLYIVRVPWSRHCFEWFYQLCNMSFGIYTMQLSFEVHTYLTLANELVVDCWINAKRIVCVKLLYLVKIKESLAYVSFHFQQFSVLLGSNSIGKNIKKKDICLCSIKIWFKTQ